MKSTVSVSQSDPLRQDLGDEIKAPLGSALGSLSINLEEELNRYRRQQQGQMPPKPRHLRMKVRQKPVDLISIPAKRVSSTPNSASQAKISGAIAIPPPPPPNPFLIKQVQRERSLGKPDAGNADYRESFSQSEGMLSKLDPKQGLSDQLEPASQDLDSQALVSPHAFAPDDYLASSEELINSLADPDLSEPPKRQPKFAVSSLVVWPDGLSSPLGMGILLAVLVGSASLGYLLTNPTVLGQIPLVKRFTADSEATAESNQLPDRETGLFGNDPLQGTGPNLSEREFRELNLQNLSTIEVEPGVTVLSPASTPTTASTPATASTPSTTASTTNSTPATTPAAPVASATPSSRPQAPAQSTQAGQSSAPRATQSAPAPQPAARPSAQPQAPAPAASQPAPAPSSPPAASVPASPPASSGSSTNSDGGAYDVVTDFTGDQSLQDARNAVGDAYLRNYSDGARIQLGTYDTPEAAQQRVQELQNQGIPARVQGQ